MGVAELFAQRGTCSRLQVGVVIARDGRILTTGYNGAPKGLPHCDHVCTCNWGDKVKFRLTPLKDFDSSIHYEKCPAGPCKTAIHAEANAIAYAAKHGILLERCEVYCTHTPCLACAQLLINIDTTKIYVKTAYRDSSGLELLRSAGCDIIMA